MTPEQYGNLRRLAKKYRIFFDGPLPQDQWPTTHVDLFHNIQLLGQKTYDEYKADKTDCSADEPWGPHTARRAERIVEIAKRLRSENRNEAGWRLDLEPEIFSRFTIEVACPQCRARVWRSEIEASIDTISDVRPSLEDRRKRRVPCRCPPANRQQDIFDSGLNPLFSDRAEELIVHDNIIHPELPKQEHPDRVYGLRETHVFERALSAHVHTQGSESTGAVQVRDAVRSSPFRQYGDPLLYPFLVLEAKSEKGPDSFDSIEMQTSFPIRTLLKLQEELQKHCQYKPTWQHGPTVWFLANKGEEWRVSAGFIKASGEDTNYRIIDLWHGRVVSKDGALQLLLIIDHIFDWARDVYRSAIRRHLRFLSEPDTTDAMSMTHDSDIFSTNRPAPSSIGSQLGFEDFGIDDGESEELSDELRPMRLLDSPQGVLRDAALVEYKFLSFTITGDNTRTILQSFLPAQATKFARGVLSWLGFRGGLMVVDTETLDYLENMWTGELRQTKPLAAQKSFHTRVNFKTWLTNEWVIVKELSCLAISNDAIDVLMESANRMRRPCLDSHVATKDHLIDLFQPFKKCSPDHNLRAAAMRLALSSYAILTVIQDRFRRKGRQNADWLAVKQRHIDKMMEAESPNLFMLLEEVKGDPTHLLVDEIYRKHKIGRREPTESYIRISVSIDSQTLDESTKDYPHPMPGNTCLDRQSKYVLVAGSCLHRSLWTTNSPEVCLFIRTRQKHKDKDLDQLRHLVGQALEICLKQDRNILSTSRYGPSKPFSSLTWNLKDTISTGMGQHRPRIRQWLYRLREEHGPIGISRFLPNGGPDSPVEDGKGMSGFDEKPADSAGPRTPNRRSPKAARTTEAFPNDPSSLRYRVRLISGRWVDQ